MLFVAAIVVVVAAVSRRSKRRSNTNIGQRQHSRLLEHEEY